MTNIPKLKVKQREIYDIIIKGIVSGKQELMFVYGHGGTGKTFLWKTLIGSLRADGRIVLAVASSGMASLLLPVGRISHARFKLPLDLTDESLCKISKNTLLGERLRQIDLIVWDEAPMNERRYFETLDRTLRDLLGIQDHLFGGKSIILGGDFRQTLRVKKGALRAKIIASSVILSYLWQKFIVLTLTENMRVKHVNMIESELQQISEFTNWLLDVGNGNIGAPDAEDIQSIRWIEIPMCYCIPDNEAGLSQLIGFIYDDSICRNPTAATLQERAIVCPKNDTAHTINLKILSMVEGIVTTYESFDQATAISSDMAETELLYPTEYLNILSFSGLPPHLLELKSGEPVMLLRNINLSGGLCNGTGMIVERLLHKLIEVQIITGTRVGEKVFIHRIP